MKVTQKNLLRTIKDSLGRFMAIMGIIALGAAIFVGLIITKADMVATGQKFMDCQHMFDLRLYSSYGWTQAEVDQVAQMEGIDRAEGMISMDVIGQSDAGNAAVYKLHAIPELVDQVYLLGGRMPEGPDECLVDGFHVDDSIIGTEFIVSTENDPDTLDSLRYHTYTVVGYVSTPLYMDMNRGTTSLGNGTVASYVYLPREAFDTDYFTDISVTLKGDHTVYSARFDQLMEEMAEALRPHVTVLAEDRFASLKADGEKEYADGYQEYLDGRKEFEEGRDAALKELQEAYDQLLNAQLEIDENRALLEDGRLQLQAGQAELDAQKKLILTSRQQLADAKAEAYSALASAYAELMKNYRQVSEAQKQVRDGLAQLDSGIAQLESGLQQMEEGKQQLQLVISLKELQVSALEAALKAPMLTPELSDELEAQLEAAKAELAEYEAQRRELEEMLVTYTAQLEELRAQRAEVEETMATLEDAMETIELGMLELENSQTQAENEFAAAEAKLESGQLQLDDAQSLLDAKKLELEAGLLALEEGRLQLDAGWEEYYSGKEAADKELAEAEKQLEDAAAQLAEARQTLDTMAPAEVFLLDRNTNSGYVSLDSNSDIVQGVSKVFPAFFLLVAALVCITTMTRMVEEERMQIGTMKALGYSNGAIMRKYLLYAGIASVVGCGLGVFLGSVVFPIILWGAYGIILNILPNIVLGLNWTLNLTVVGAYVAVMELVTWYCCRRCLKEVPAELLRAKAPTSGKKIWLEYLPFWKKISFLNKVMLRNVFRYRQRMFMMLVGIGGCTALLLTGFGIRDSIMNIVTQQFQQVTVYDMNVYFDKVQSFEDQGRFCEELRRELSGAHFYYQTSVELEFEGREKSLSLIAGQEGLTDFIKLKQEGEPLQLPGVNEALLSVGLAEQMGVEIGDTVVLRDSDMRALEVTVTGIFDNNVNAYAIVLPETIEKQWGDRVEPQMAFLNLRDTADLYEAGAKITSMEGVLNLSISQDLQNQVSGMLEALNMVVVTIVICAGALAVIVLYNLTNINITERLREIATLKVLGFYAKESAAYVFKENLLLSGMGTLVGLVLGKLLLEFVISEIKVDMVYFSASFTPMSAVLSVVLTMLAACLVDFLLYFKLEKINMAEALKSVE